MGWAARARGTKEQRVAEGIAKRIREADERRKRQEAWWRSLSPEKQSMILLMQSFGRMTDV